MTFDEWWSQGGRGYLEFNQDVRRYARKAWDAATAQARADCADLVWEFRGCCVSDESARALMEHVRRGDRRE